MLTKQWNYRRQVDFVKDVFLKNFLNFVRPKKTSLVSANRPGKNFLYHSLARLIQCASEYTFVILKNNKQTTTKNKNKKKQKKLKKKREYLRKIDYNLAA